MTLCAEENRKAGLSYPRTCPTCKLGPCQRGHWKGTQAPEQMTEDKDATIARLREQVNTVTTEKHADAEAIGALEAKLAEVTAERDEWKDEYKTAEKGLNVYRKANVKVIAERDAARAEGFTQGIEAAAEVADDHTPAKHGCGTLAAHVTGATIARAIRALSPTPQADPVREPDYCYDPEEWEYTMQWEHRGEMVESLLDGIPSREIARVKTLLQGPDKWVARIPIDTDGDGEADDWETMWFDNEASALRALAQKGE